MVAPSAQSERMYLQLVAAWTAEVLAGFLLQAAWCCAAVVLQARTVNSRSSALGLDLCLSSSGKQKASKQKQHSSLAWCLPASLTGLHSLHTMCILQRHQLSEQQQQQLHQLSIMKTEPLFQSLVSTPKPQEPNCWLPITTPQAGDTAGSGPTTAPSEASTQGTGRSCAAGQSSSNASGSTSAQGSHHSSGQNSIPGGGGQDDSGDEDGGDKRRLAYQLAKSHSLETPDPLIAGTNTASLIQAAVDRAAAATAAESAASERQAAASTSSSSASASPAVATGPQRLYSPFAAAAAASASTVASAAPAGAGSSSQPAPRRMQSPFAAAQQPTAQQAASSGAPAASRGPVSPFAAAQASTSPQQAAAMPAQAQAAATGPWKLASPFAAASVSPAVSVSPALSTGGRVTQQQSPAASVSPAVSTGGRVAKPRSPSEKARSPGSSARSAQQPPRAPSPFSAAQQGRTSPFGSSSSASSGSGGSTSRQAAATAAAAYAASRASKGTSSSVGSRGPAAATGPWKLQSPFAAAPMPAFSATATQLDAVAEDEPLDMASSSAAAATAAAASAQTATATWGRESQLRPTQQSIDAVVAAAAAARQQQRSVAGSSPPLSLASSGHGKSPDAITPARSNQPEAFEGSAPMQPVGPGGIRSPFAAAAAVAAATDAAFTPSSTPRASPTGSATGRYPQKAAESPTQGSRKGSAGSRARQVSSMAHSISLNTMMSSSAFGSSSVVSGSTAERMTVAEVSSGSLATIRTKTSSGATQAASSSSGQGSLGQGSGSGGSLPAAAGATAAVDGSAASAAEPAVPASAAPVQQPQQARRAPPSAWQSPFAAAAQPAAVAAPARTPAAAPVRPAASRPRAGPQQVGFRPTVMPIAVSAGTAGLMPPVLMAMPPTQQQMAAAVSYQAGLATVPMGMGAGASTPAVLVPQYVLPTSAGLVSAAGLVAPTTAAGFIPVPMSGGMPAFFVHPSLVPAMQAGIAQQSAAASLPAVATPTPRRMPAQASSPPAQVQSPAAATRASPFAAAPRASPFAAAQAALAAVASAGPAGAGTPSGAASTGSEPAAAAGAGFGAEPAPKLGCMCMAPACLPEGAASQVQVYVLGLEGRKAQPGPGHTYRVAAFMGSSLIAETKRECKGGERLLRISLPALPKGVVQVLVLDDSNKPCFMQHLLVLPPPCAQDLNTLWSQILRGQIITTPAATAVTDASASAPIAASSSQTTQGGSLYGSNESSKGAATSSSSFTSAALGSSIAAALQQAPGQPKRLGPLEIQDLWRNSYSRVMTDVAAVLLTWSKSQELPTGVTSASTAQRAAAARTASPAGITPRTSFDTPEMRDKVGGLLHFFATHNKWAVLELLTSHVYGYGSSAKAMYTSKVLGGLSVTGSAAVTPATSSSPDAAAVGMLAAQAAPTAVVDAPAGPGRSTASGPASPPQAQGSRSQQQQGLVPVSEIQPEGDANVNSGDSGTSFSFQGLLSSVVQRPLSESRSIAPASSGATAATASSGADAALASALSTGSGGARVARAGSARGTGGERGVRTVLQVKKVFKRAFSGKQ